MTKSVDEVIKNWPENPGKAAEWLRDYYGEPDEYSDSGIIWHNTSDDRRRTILSREEYPHNFPAPHTYYPEQFIDYKVPPEFYSKLAEYDGNVIAERTKGELSARCGGTSMNFVAINLAHDIITGKRTDSEQDKNTAVCILLSRRERNHRIHNTKFSVQAPGTEYHRKERGDRIEL